LIFFIAAFDYAIFISIAFISAIIFAEYYITHIFFHFIIDISSLSQLVAISLKKLTWRH